MNENDATPVVRRIVHVEVAGDDRDEVVVAAGDHRPGGRRPGRDVDGHEAELAEPAAVEGERDDVDGDDETGRVGDRAQPLGGVLVADAHVALSRQTDSQPHGRRVSHRRQVVRQAVVRKAPRVRTDDNQI